MLAEDTVRESTSQTYERRFRVLIERQECTHHNFGLSA
jgi:hypothetical protein